MSMSVGQVRLDDRAGSRDLYAALVSVGLSVSMTRLPYGDIEFDGLGRDDVPVLIGVEHKIVSDAVRCMLDGRFAGHQLPGLASRFDYVWLFVEGATRADQSGRLQILGDRGRWYDACAGNRQVGYCDFDSWLLSQELRGGIRVRRTRDQAESAAAIRALCSWWSRGWEMHRSHQSFNLSDPPSERVLLTQPGIVRRMAKELSGVGWERSGAIEGVFRTPIEMVAATKDEWMGIDGIGEGIARKIMRELGSDKLWDRGEVK